MPSFDGISEADLSAIRGTVSDYYEGWCRADGARMERAIHPRLAKRAVIRRADGSVGFDESAADEMIAATGAGEGARYGGELHTSVLHAFRNVATVLMRSDPYVEYLHLARVDGAWRIINALWEPTDSWLELNPSIAHCFTDR
ncbi:MAG: nuclear transport factor 2 family protein [Candidatus Limnocylindria bacterium]